MANSEKKWELVQIKAFTSWLNEILSHKNTSVSDIKTDLSDGVKLIYFLEVLTGKKVLKKWDANPPSRIQRVSNVHIALGFLEKETDVKLVGIGVEDFVDENQKMILGFLWSLYKKFKIATIKQGDKSSEEALLLWVRETTDGYPGVKVENYKHSFKDALAFSALADRFAQNKELFDFDKVDKDDSVAALNHVFDFAEKEMGVPRLLDPEEVAAGAVDERSMVLYTSLYFHAFKAKQDREGLLLEQTRISEQMRGLEGSLEERAKKAAALQEENDALKAELEELRKWKEEHIKLLETRDQELEREREIRDDLARKLGEHQTRVEELEKWKEENSRLLETRDQELAKGRENREDLERKLKESQAQVEELSKWKTENSQLLETRDKELKEERENKEDLEKKLGESETKLQGLELQLSELQGNYSDVSSKFETFKKEANQFKEENESRNLVQNSGLGVLVKSLNEHLEGLHRWERYLEIGDLPDFGELQNALVSEIKGEDFDKQLKVLSDKLDLENNELVEALKVKEEEAKQRKLVEAKKKERQEKQAKA